MLKRNQLIAALLALVLFGCGFASGVLAHRLYRDSVVNATTSAENAREHYLSEMQSKLKLTPAQLTQLQTILDDTKAQTKAARERIHPEMVRIKEQHIARIKSILTPDQAAKYEQLVAERERRVHPNDDHDHPHGGPR